MAGARVILAAARLPDYSFTFFALPLGIPRVWRAGVRNEVGK